MRPRAVVGSAWARWGLLASTLALGAALIIASWANYRSARNATAALHQGQAGVLLGALRGALHAYQADRDTTELESVLSERSAEGLRYVALLDMQGEIVASVGKTSPLPLPAVRPTDHGEGMQIIDAGRVVRVVIRFPPRPPGGPHAPELDREHAGRASVLLFEFEPLVASNLMRRAERLLEFGLAAALVMMIAGGIFWRMSRRYEAAVRHLERERRLSLLGEMTAVLAHEIRNPLASLKGHAQLLAERLAPASAERRKAGVVIAEASRLEALTTDLLDFARTGPLDLAPVDVADLMRASAEEVAVDGFILDLKRAPDRWRLDATRTRQALTNLLRNAHQATSDPDKRPIVNVFMEKSALVIEIRDFGAGLPQGQEQRIFDPFFTTRVNGTGLGLAVARRVVELHGGTIVAANHPEGGAVFRIELPETKA